MPFVTQFPEEDNLHNSDATMPVDNTTSSRRRRTPPMKSFRPFSDHPDGNNNIHEEGHFVDEPLEDWEAGHEHDDSTAHDVFCSLSDPTPTTNEDQPWPFGTPTHTAIRRTC